MTVYSLRIPIIIENHSLQYKGFKGKMIIGHHSPKNYLIICVEIMSQR